MSKLNLSKDTKSILLTLGTAATSILSGVVMTMFEKDRIAREVERTVDKRKLP